MDVTISHDPWAPEGTEAAEPAVAPEVVKLGEKQWTHAQTDEVFATKHEAVADAAVSAAQEPPAPAEEPDIPEDEPQADTEPPADTEAQDEPVEETPA